MRWTTFIARAVRPSVVETTPQCTDRSTVSEDSMTLHSTTLRALILLVLPLASAAAQQDSAATRICLAPPSAETATGNSTSAIDAVREAFTSFLTGPSLGVTPLSARLESQVREEARAAGCPYLLLSAVKHVRKTGGGGLLRRMAGGAVQQGAWAAAAGAGSTVGRVAAGAAAGAVGAAAYDFASSVRTKDELTLTYRLESAAGQVLVDKTERRKAQSDGQDLLTPIVENAAKAIAAAVAKGRR